jgi:hypothetical protein
VVHKFKKQLLPQHMLADVFERVSRDLLCQWLVLQSKRESELGPLRALYLIDARNAAISSLRAANLFLPTEASRTASSSQAG